MKHVVFLILMKLPLLIYCQGVKWHTDLSWEELKLKAKQENKFIFLDCYTTWCGPCKKMDMFVYNNDSVGNELNNKFLSIKVQFDKTDSDGVQIRNWYKDVGIFEKKFNLKGFPSLLFFSPSGDLISKKTGYRDVPTFLQLVKEVQDPKQANVSSDYNEYKQGRKDYKKLIDLSTKVEDILSDKSAADSIAKDYIVNYFNNLPDSEMLTSKKLFFLQKHIINIGSKDRIFSLMYNNPSRIDTIFNIKGHTARIISAIIRREEITNKLWKDGRPGENPVKKEPDWSSIEKSISSKYGSQYVNKLIPNSKITFYFLTSNWPKYISLIENAIKRFPPHSKETSCAFSIYVGDQFLDDAWALNGIAWSLFLKCNDKRALEKALEWSELSMKICTDSSVVFQYIDTKANLIYKLHKLFNVGNARDAIELEKKTFGYNLNAGFIKEYEVNLSRMINGERTWH